jgi:hypothetical protein
MRLTVAPIVILRLALALFFPYLGYAKTERGKRVQAAKRASNVGPVFFLGPEKRMSTF